MAKNLDDLSILFAKRAKDFPVKANRLGGIVTMILVRELLEKTPVDTTQALSNWQVTLDRPAQTFIDAYVPGYGGYTSNASAAATVWEANIALDAKKLGQKIYVTNNAPYIRKLNSGSSKQAPAGFVEAALMMTKKRMKTLRVL